MAKYTYKIHELFQKKDSFFTMLVITPNGYEEATADTIYYLTNTKRFPGVCVLVNNPFNRMKELLEKEGISTKGMIFIDTISKISGAGTKEAPNCIYLNSPENLSDIGIAINEALSAIDYKDKFVFFDSVATLAEFNQIENIIKFFHFLSVRLKSQREYGMLMHTKEDRYNECIKEVEKFCNFVTNLTEVF